MKKVLMIFLLLLVSVTPALAADADFERLTVQAQNGDAAAQYELGLVYENAPDDDAQALEWYQKAAAQGHAAAQFKTGVFYEQGRAVARDDLLAFDWYHKAAAQGHGKSLLRLGAYYRNGYGGISVDFEQALLCYLQAVEAGEPYGYIELAVYYMTDEAVPANFQHAYAWLLLGAAQTADEATARVAEKMLQDLEPGLTEAQIEAARERAAAWQQRH